MSKHTIVFNIPTIMDIPITLKLEELENMVWKFSNVN
jgi:hypothetical protein